MSDQDQHTTNGNGASGGAKVKPSKRITPPKAVRDAVSMKEDELWGWYWNDDTDTLYIQRSAVSRASVPDDTANVGAMEARRNGKYIDFSVPMPVVENAGMAVGTSWEFTTLDSDTMQAEPRDDDWYVESADQRRLAAEHTSE